jgi:HSP20 family molecular chaperone IbpA
MQAVGYHQLPPHARVRENALEYVVELDVADFTQAELQVQILGHLVTVRGNQTELPSDEGKAFRIHEHLEETFRLPDDSNVHEIQSFYKHGVLELRVPRVPLAPQTIPIERRPPSLINPDAEAD